MGFMDRFKSRRKDTLPAAFAPTRPPVDAPAVPNATPATPEPTSARSDVPAVAPIAPAAPAVFVAAAAPAGPAIADVPWAQLTFCCVDVETTGLDPAGDRIVEIALTRVDWTGHVLDELHTIVDPQGPIDGTFVHGLDERAVRGAPTFSELAGAVLAMLDGTVIAAHNATFDLSFLRAELARAGHPVGEMPYVCTMVLRRQVGLPGATAHRLSWAAWQEGVAVEAAHVAVCDGRATAGLLARYLAHAAAGGSDRLGQLPARGRAAASWQSPAGQAVPMTAAAQPQLRSRPGVSAAPASVLRSSPAAEHAVSAYRLQLAAAAEDFEVDEHEVDELSELVLHLGLTPDQVRACHTERVRALLDDRLDDGLLTWAEQHEVRAFARLLGVGDRDVAEMIVAAEQVADVEGKPSMVAGAAVGAGLSVCFTGEFVAIPLTREEVWELADDAGMVVSKGVTKKLDVLVCIDPARGTTKLRKAAEYGTVVIDQHTFLGLAGVQPAPDGVLREVLDQLAQRRAATADAEAARRETAAAAARERNRQRARQRRETGATEQTLWCSVGEHEWTRPPQRGRPPRACPEHQAVITQA